MLLHGNARLNPFQRTLLCERVRLEGWTVEEAAFAAGCSERTAYRWLARWRAGEAMTDRSSAPHHVANRTPDVLVSRNWLTRANEHLRTEAPQVEEMSLHYCLFGAHVAS